MKVNLLQGNKYEYEDYFLFSPSILAFDSGTYKLNNVTNILYPYQNTKVKFNTSEAIKLLDEDIEMTIDDSHKVDNDNIIEGFNYKAILKIDHHPKEDIKGAFIEFNNYECKYRDCMHNFETEEECMTHYYRICACPIEFSKSSDLHEVENWCSVNWRKYPNLLDKIKIKI